MRRFRPRHRFIPAVLLLSALGAALPAAAGGQDRSSDQLARLIEEVEEFREVPNRLPLPPGTDERYRDRMPEVSAARVEESAQAAARFLERLQAIDRSTLSTPERIDARVLELQLRDELAEARFRTYLVPIRAAGGFHANFARMPDSRTFRSVSDYDTYIARLQSFLEHTRQQIAAMRQGMAEGITLPRPVMHGFEETIRAQIVDDVRESDLWTPFERIPESIAPEDRERILRHGEQALRESVIPAYRELFDFVVEEYIPAARTTVGLSALPGGREYYEERVRFFTTLDITPEEVHEIGLSEVERLRGEMAKVIEEVGFQGSFREFLDFLRTDPRFYVTEPEDYIREAGYIAKRMDGQLPNLFKVLPETPYGIQPIPDFIAPRATGAYYSRGTPGERAGNYFLNLSEISSRPLYVLEALTFHEAVPGHHLQIMLHMENEEISEFRRSPGITAFVEGWALYAERLGLEVGFFRDPYSNFGRLTYEIWRACRLVVDTGIHALGWSRQQAIDYMADNTALSIHEVTTEVDRYISGPGQAVAYKMGELKITELRRRAEAALGNRFDVREFHDVVLRNGAIPLSFLEDEVDAYIRRTQSSALSVEEAGEPVGAGAAGEGW